MTTSLPLLSLRGISKTFGGTRALVDVDLDVHRGQTHAMLGENGAGKSTLIKILAGAYRADAGEFRYDGATVDPQHDRLPIAFIHQDLGLVETMTVAENIGLVLGYPRAAGLISWRDLRRRAVSALESIGVELDPDQLVGGLSQAEQSLVAIARAVSSKARVLVLDEPTARLPEHDVARLFATLGELRRSGVGMIYVTHRLDEVFRAADEITVLRDGRRVATGAVSDTTPSELVRQIVGRPPDDVFSRSEAELGPAVLTLTDVRTRCAGPVTASFHQGEIVGLVGLVGGGQNSIGRAVFGADQIRSGTLTLRGASVRRWSPGAAIAAGVGFVSGARIAESLAMPLVLRENLFPNPTATGRSLFRPISRRGERLRAAEIVTRLDIRTSGPDALISVLSGGNQQKAVIARWLDVGSRLLVLEEPTLGVDVGAKAQIYAVLRDLTAAGATVLIVSSDFEEVAGVCSRAIVFGRGRPLCELTSNQLSIESLVRAASGSTSLEETA